MILLPTAFVEFFSVIWPEWILTGVVPTRTTHKTDKIFPSDLHLSSYYLISISVCPTISILSIIKVPLKTTFKLWFKQFFFRLNKLSDVDKVLVWKLIRDTHKLKSSLSLRHFPTKWLELLHAKEWRPRPAPSHLRNQNFHNKNWKINFSVFSFLFIFIFLLNQIKNLKKL